jgi:signal transduction histidine kinase/ActR/RegA family two-component response regulator
MKTTIIQKIVLLPTTILNTGISQYSSDVFRKHVIRLNLFLSFCLGLSLINLFFNAVNDLYLSAFVNLSGTLLLTFAFYMIKDGQYEKAKITGIVTINLNLFVLSYVEGFRSGQYMLIFPLLLALIFVIDSKKNMNELVFTSVVTLLTTAFIFVFAPYHSQVQPIPDILYATLFSTNLSISLLLTTLFAYIILKTLENHEEKILDEKKLTDTIYDTSLDAVFIVDAADLMIKDCNVRALNVFGFNNKLDLIRQPVQHLLGNAVLEHIRNINNNEFTNTTPWYGNMDFERAGEEIFYAYVNIVPFSHQNRKFCKISILDITEIKVAEFEIIKAKERAEKAAKVKARFLSNMSHELRTPLNAIIGTSNILLQEEYLHAQRESFDVLKHSSEHMLQLVNDILDLSKLEAGKMELEKIPFNLKDFMNRVTAPFQKSGKSNLDLELVVDPELDMEIISDETRLLQIMNNLLSNAVKFTNQGKITVTARVEKNLNHEITVYFAVEDTGIGIPHNKIKQIFESFTQADTETTRKYGGTGLGLAICKYLVVKMGGEINVESEPGRGSRFFFTATFQVNTQKSYVNEESLKQLNSLEGIRVLLAEDNPINMLVAKRFLQKWKLIVDEAVNGLDAVEQYSKNHYDLLLIDLEMPEMDGIEVAAHIRQSNRDIPIVAFTAAVYDDMQADLMNKGFTEFIPKPFRPEDLHKKILQLTAYDQLQKYKYG